MNTTRVTKRGQNKPRKLIKTSLPGLAALFLMGLLFSQNLRLAGYYMPWAIPEFVGRGSCFLQAWSSAASNWLSIQGFFRLKPDPVTRVITVQPQLPTSWEYTEAKNLSIWGGRYDLRLDRSGNQLQFSFVEIEAGPQKLRFEVVLEPILPASFV